MRAAFDFALHFAGIEQRGGIHPIVEHQAVGYAFADAKIAIEAARYLSWRACHAVDTQSPAADELAIQARRPPHPSRCRFRGGLNGPVPRCAGALQRVASICNADWELRIMRYSS
jgi:alkylation response protein AidB-like acyl-CoA dehydrogenase